MSQETNDTALGGAFGGEGEGLVQTNPEVEASQDPTITKIVTEDNSLGGTFGSDESPLAQSLSGEAATAAGEAQASEEAAQISATNAANSASAAATSATNASTSETNAATSAIDASLSETNAVTSAYTATTKANEASTSATNASTSATNAATSATNAATSETNAATSATNASNSDASSLLNAQEAQSSASQASTSASNAAGSATLAGTHKDAAEDAQGASETARDQAQTYATNSQTSATQSEASATAAATSASEASDSETNAATSETNASTSATNASNSATASANSATQAANSATQAATSATNAATSATNAFTSETNAATSATNSSDSATASATSASEASTSASNALTSEGNASDSATASATSATNAATSATNASTSEGNAATSATNAATSETNAATSATNAATSATNAATSATESSDSAGDSSVSATQSATSATNAATSATNAATSETNAATSESNAAASASEASVSEGNAEASANNASTSATNAANSATAASNSASAAATSASNAASSASAASSSAANASVSETNAANLLDQFEDIYLGSKTSDPTLDNDGDTLQVGSLYFNSTTNDLKIWTGSVWTQVLVDAELQTIVDDAIADLIDSAPTALNTLNELAAALGDDPNFSATISNQIGTLQNDVATLGNIKYEEGDDISVSSVTLEGAATGVGLISWDATNETASMTMGNGVTQQIGEELYYPKRTRNMTGFTIPNGTPVMLVGGVGEDSYIAPAIADGSIPHEYYAGLTTEAIADGDYGRVLFFGSINDIDTSSYTKGDLLYVSDTTHGAFTTTPPEAPSHAILSAIVTKVGTTDGRLFVRVHTNPEAGEITFDNATSGLVSSSVQGAIDELQSNKVDVTGYNNTNWDTAYGWGDHDGLYLPIDAVTLPDQTGHSGQFLTTNGTTADWATVDTSLGDTAYGWGDHSTEGYLTSFTETDPTVPSHVKSITTTNISNWNTAYGWGDHSTEGYLTSFDITTQTDPKYLRSDVADTTSSRIDFRAGITSQTLDIGYTGDRTIQALSNDLTFGTYGDLHLQHYGGDLHMVHGGGTMYDNGNRVFSDRYHPNADKWTTARTISLSGDLNGSVSLDGSANVTLSAQVVNNSHSHSNYLNKYSELSSGDLNTFAANESGVYFGNDGYSGVSNIPYANYFTMLHLRNPYSDVNSASNSLDRAAQLWFGDTPGRAYWRPYQGSTTGWHGWENIWTTANDGSGSGLDADLLDGYHASSFLAKSGGTMTGDLLVQDDIKSTGQIRATGWWNTNTGTSGHDLATEIGVSAGVSHILSYNRASSSYGNLNISAANVDFPQGNVSIGGATAWHSANDGSGSGLDADLLDGQHGSYYWNKSTIGCNRNIASGTNLSTDLESGGTFKSYGAANTSWDAPFSYGGVIGYDFDTGIKGQVGFDIRHNTSDYGNFWFRTKNNLGYNNWTKVWHDRNDGSGSGLDADLLDGQHASAFAPASHSHNYVTEGGTSFNGEYPVTVRTGTRTIYSDGNIKFRGSDSRLTVDGSVHSPSFVGALTGNASTSSKWTTARTNTVTLTGDASGSGSASVDGTGNWTVSVPVVVNNDSHYHSQVYIPDTRGAARAPSYYPDRYTSFDFQNTSDTGAGGDSWHVLQTVAPWSTYNASHRQQQLAFTGTGGVKFRYATSDSAWAGWQTLWTSGNDGSGSGLDADLLDGLDESAFARRNGSAVQDFYVDDLYYDQWIRNNSTSSSGLYWHNSSNPGYAWHIYPQTRADMTMRTGSGNGGIKGTIENDTARGYVHWTTTNEIGFLNNSRSWSLRVDSSGNSFHTASARAPIFYDSNNTGYYGNFADSNNSLRVAGNIKSIGNYGRGMVGVYSSTRLQHLWSMGEAYLLAANGTTSGNMYGIAWSHPNAGTIGGANNLASHGMLILENGVFKGAWGGGRLVTTNDIRGTLFYDYNNTGYYSNPSSTSNFNTLNVAGGNLVNTASKSTSGWWKCAKTGVIMQWARIYVSANSTTYWTFPTAFPSACRSISANQESSNAGIGDNSQFYSISRTGATLRNGWNSSATYFTVFAIGY